MTISTNENSFNHLVYLRIFEGCNLHCQHCFIPNNPKKMTDELIKDVPNILRNKIPLQSTILLQWHGGEPTLFGPDVLRKHIENIELNKDYKWLHGIQTNLTTYHENKDKWNDLYHTYFNSEVGVSWDYKIRKFRGDADSSNFEKIFWNNIDEIIKANLKPYLIVTANKVFFQKYKNPFEFFDMLKEKNIHKVHLERITKTGYARDSWDEIGLNNKEYSEFMSKFFKSYYVWKKTHEDYPLFCSPFDGIVTSLTELKNNTAEKGYGCLSGICDTTFHTIDANGYKKGCTALNSEVDNKKSNVANVHNIVFFSKKSLTEQRETRQADCINCQYKTICSSGCMTIDKIDSSNECSGGYTLFNNINKLISS